MKTRLDNKPSRPRRIRDWNEEERRRKKEKMRLDIEKENMKCLTSPVKKPGTSFKQISPDDRTALNILDGTSPNKAKRLRPKTRRYGIHFSNEKLNLNILKLDCRLDRQEHEVQPKTQLQDELKLRQQLVQKLQLSTQCLSKSRPNFLHRHNYRLEKKWDHYQKND